MNDKCMTIDGNMMPGLITDKKAERKAPVKRSQATAVDARPKVVKKTATAKAPARAKSATKKKDGRIFGLFLVFSLLTVACVGAYESFMQGHMPELSIVSMLHSYGLLTDVEVLYKPSRSIWRPFGWTGSFMMIFMMVYSIRKRFHFMSSLGPLKYWLRGHIFLGLMGPLLITLHTTFKFNGIVATSFWAMIITVCFGIMGRYIYSQIPRSINGHKMKAGDIDQIVEGLDTDLSKHLSGKNISDLMGRIITPDHEESELSAIRALAYYIKVDLKNFFGVKSLKKELKLHYTLSRKVRGEIVGLLKKKSALIRKRNLLATSQRILDYWHVVHIPLAVLMFLIMFVHIVAYFLFRPMV